LFVCLFVVVVIVVVDVVVVVVVVSSGAICLVSHPPGQIQCVDVRYLVAKNTIDETIWRLVQKKLSVCDGGNGQLLYFSFDLFDFLLVNCTFAVFTF
jgi:hypothetical protein